MLLNKKWQVRFLIRASTGNPLNDYVVFAKG
jgi:hypothetical protein